MCVNYLVGRSSVDVSKDREMISQLEQENLDRRKLTRSLRVANLKPDWRRSTIHTSQPYSPIKNYHRLKAKMERVTPTYSGLNTYRRSLENLEREAEERLKPSSTTASKSLSLEELRGAMSLSKYYREPRHMYRKRGDRYSYIWSFSWTNKSNWSFTCLATLQRS